MHYTLNDAEKILSLGVSLAEIAAEAGLRRFRLKRKQEGESIRGVDAWAIARVYAGYTGVSDEAAMEALFTPVPTTYQNAEKRTLLDQEYDAALSDMEIGDGGEIMREGEDLVQMRRALIGAARRRDMRVEIVSIRDDALTFRLHPLYPSYHKKYPKRAANQRSTKGNERKDH